MGFNSGDKMKCILIFISAILVSSTKGHLRPYESMNCVHKIDVVQAMQNEVLDLDANADEELKTCVLKNIHFDQSVLLINGNYSHGRNTIRSYSTSVSPNILIMTKNLTPSMLDWPAVKRLLRSHRSLLFFAITDDETFKCEGGNLSANDFLSLQDFMNKLWHKFKISHVGVTFPLACTDKIAIYGGKKHTDQMLYDRTIKLIDLDNTEELYKVVGENRALLTEDYPLQANIFERFPTSITQCERLHYYTKINLSITNGYCGLDALVMHDVVKHFKFKIDFSKDSTCSGYGYSSPDNVTGSLKCIVQSDIDISFNSRFMTKYYQEQIYFLHFVAIDSLCVILKQVEIIPIWQYAVTVYPRALWILILFVIITIGLFMWAMATIKNKLFGFKRINVYYYMQDALTSMMFGYSFNKKFCILRGICLCSSILFLSIYQGHINYVFTTLLRYKTIQTLDDLYQSDKILYVSPTMRELLKQIHDPKNKLQSDFLQRNQFIDKNYDTLDVILQKPHAALIDRRDIMMKILSDYVDGENNMPLIYIVDQCFNTYYLSYVSRSGFPFVEELQRFMQRVREAGLPSAYNRWTCNMLRVPSTLPKPRSQPRPFEKIQLEHQRVAFSILIFGHVVSFVTFLVELWIGKRDRSIVAIIRMFKK